ncbi:MAG: peptidylprolyl isomerase [Bacteroidaceae bacterium]|nr:peptidylprolyl isomerase [Bacteroidaceae bacterium]
MKKILLGVLVAVLFISCGDDNIGKDGKSANNDTKQNSGFVVKDFNTDSPDCDQYVLMSTSHGDVKIKLYRETPQHRKNFINLVKNGYYDGQIFYRVVPGSFIQAGDYTSIKNPKKRDIGTNDVDYTIPSEIDPSKRVHKRGALAAASYNRGEYSSGSHFYIVSNKKVKEKEIDAAEKTYTNELVNMRFREIQKPYSKELAKLRALGETDNSKKREHDKKVNELLAQARNELKGKEFHYTKSQRKAFLKDGGMPALDPHYTVFGEVVEGMDVIDSISSVSVYDGRPREDVFIKKITVVNDTK